MPLLIVDDLGMRKLPASAAEDLLELIMRRHKRASTILTSNRPVDDWGKLLGDTPAITAMLDRLLDDGHVIKCGPKSWHTRSTAPCLRRTTDPQPCRLTSANWPVFRRSLRFEHAIAFKRHLAEQDSQVTGGKLSKSTLRATLAHLKRFFQCLASEPGFRSRLRYFDAEYFNLSDKDTRVATARREKMFPNPEQMTHVIARMPAGSDMELRNRTLVAFILLTGTRDSAAASMSLKHVDLVAGCVHQGQDARDVNTKFSKTFSTYFFPVGVEIRNIVEHWVTYLVRAKLWGNDDSLFPATKVVVRRAHQFEASGLKRERRSSAAPIRAIFRDAVEAAAVRYFNPHSLRDTLVHLSETLCRTPENFKAWSQSLGHEGVLTTFYSYGAVGSRRQGEIIRTLAEPRQIEPSAAVEIAKAVARELRKSESTCL